VYTRPLFVAVIEPSSCIIYIFFLIFLVIEESAVNVIPWKSKKKKHEYDKHNNSVFECSIQASQFFFFIPKGVQDGKE
jgi:hypothetical protein